MPIIQWSPEPAWMTVLAVDAMYFHAAQQAYERARSSTKAIDRAEQRVARLQSRIDRLNEQRDEGELGASAHYDKLEPLAIRMEDVEYGVGVAYGPFLQYLATVHVFCAAALEAHVNIRGQELLTGRMFDVFERLPLDAKWLLLPTVRGLQGFEAGAEPFQGFDRLTRIRNKLVHYRVRREPWRGSAAPPDFLDELGLSLAEAKRSLASVGAMTTELAKQLGERTPWWLTARAPSFFEIERERND